MTPWLVPLLGALPAPAYGQLQGSAWGWFCLAPLIAWIAHGRGGARLWFGLGWGYGLVHMGLRYGWLPEALLNQGGLRPLPFLLLMGGTVTVLALYPAALVGLSRLAWLRWRVSPLWSFPALYAAQEALLQVTPFGGAPWGGLAATVVESWGARLAAPVGGAVGLTLLLGAVNAGWAAAGTALLRAARAGWEQRAVRAGGARRWSGWPMDPRRTGAALALALVTGALAWSAPPAAPPAASETLAALLVPGDRSMAELADSSLTVKSARSFLARTTAAIAGTPAPPRAAERPVLAIWPESAVSGRPEQGRLLAALYDAAQLLETDLIFGGNARDRGRLYNSAYLVSGERFRTVRYDKRRLVPFGEYIPAGFRALLGRKLTAGVDDYAAGSRPPVLQWRGMQLGIAICFESLAAAHLREAVTAGAQAIVAISNDGWLTPGAAIHHLRLSALHGLAVGREVLFVANRGWSAHWRDGRAMALIPPGGSPLRVEARLREGLTPWTRWGNALPLTLAALYLLAGAGIAHAIRRPAD